VARRTPGTDNRVVRVCRLLNAERARYLVAGGVAANLHGSVRATKDIDLLIPPDAANTERVLRALSELTWGIARELDATEIATKAFTIIGDDPRVDLLTIAATVTFEAAWPRRLVRRVHGTRIPYLSLTDLMQSKRTGRPSDEADLEVLGGLGALPKASPRGRRRGPRTPRA
jgi:hypothetical protein